MAEDTDVAFRIEKVDRLIADYVRADEHEDFVEAGRIVAELERYDYAQVKSRILAAAHESSDRTNIGNWQETFEYQKRLGDLKNDLWCRMNGFQ